MNIASIQSGNIESEDDEATLSKVFEGEDVEVKAARRSRRFYVLTQKV